jgi:hypothetical protein
MNQFSLGTIWLEIFMGHIYISFFILGVLISFRPAILLSFLRLTGYDLDYLIWFPAGSRDFSLHHCAQTGSGIPQLLGAASVYQEFFPELKRPGPETDHSPLSIRNYEVKNECNYIVTQPQFFMTWCIIKERNNSLLYFIFLSFHAYWISALAMFKPGVHWESPSSVWRSALFLLPLGMVPQKCTFYFNIWRQARSEWVFFRDSLSQKSTNVIPSLIFNDI